MADPDLAASKKKNKAALWEEAKKKEEEEARNRLMRFRMQEAEELSRANLTADALVKTPDSVPISPRAKSKPDEPKTEPASVAVTKTTSTEASSAPAPTPAPAPAPVAPLSARSSGPTSSGGSDASKLEDEVRSLRRELADAVAAKIEAQRQVRDLEQQLNLQDERAQEQIRKLERQVATLKKDLAAATTTASSDSSAPAVTVTSSEGGAAEEEEKGGEGEGEGEGEGGAARLSNLTSGRAAPATKRKPATRRVAASSYESRETDKKSEKKEDSLLAQAAAAQKEAKAQADRERALARQKELAGGPRTSDIAHMAASSPVQLRHATDERRGSSPSVFGEKVKAAIAQEDRLVLVKGKKRIRSKQVPMTRESLNSGDVFLLETRNKIYHWNGKKSSRPERTKGVDLSNRLKRTYGSRMDIVQMDEGKTDDEAEFWKALGGRGDIKEEAAGGDDAEFEKEEDENNKLYKINEELKAVCISDGPLRREQLTSEGVFVVDCNNEFYLWHGKRSDNNFRRDAMPAVMELWNSKPRADWACIRKMLEDGEPPLFEEKFSNWPDSFEKVMAKSGATSNVAASKAGTKPDASRMWQEVVRGESRLPDDGTGRVEIWTVDKVTRGAEATKTALAPSQYGQFYSKNSYIVLYTYGTADARSYILYFWQGRDCGTNEKAAAAGLVLKMQEQYRGATQIRVLQQKEPSHFCLIFKGLLTIFQGDFSKASNDGMQLFEVRGSSVENCRTVQAQAKADALNSHHVFVLQNKDEQWTWVGEDSSDYEKEKAKDIAAQLLGGRQSRGVIAEGTEPEAFWQLLDGKGEYARKHSHKCRFFQGDNARGFFTADEVPCYSQDDLDTSQLAIVDTCTEVFVWAGHESREADKKACLELAIDYVKAALDNRSPDTPVLLVYEFSEPLRFTCHFHAWQPRKPLKKSLSKKNIELNVPAEKKEVVAASAVLTTATDLVLPYEQLKAKRDLPPGADPAKLEQYLSPEEFKKVFNMTKEEFNGLPLWKRTPMRKNAGLF